MDRLNLIHQHLVARTAQSGVELGHDRATNKRSLVISPTTLSQLQYVLENDNHETRRRTWAMIRSDKNLFAPKFGLPTATEREIAYRQLKKICGANLLSVKDFDNNPSRIFTVHELIAMVDRSTATKMTVQFNLFGGTVLRLGSARHHELIPSIDSLAQVGCFALTEVGYGNNAVEMETTAEYKGDTDEFVINTPTALSRKYWITNGAIHAHWCVVFAQTIVQGVNHGVHPFLVRIRNNELRPCEGVQIEDMGHKMGMNGVDNARISFRDFRAPRGSMLDVISSVCERGNFTSSVKTKRDRFIKQSDQLLSGRLCLAAMALGVSKVCLVNAVRYSLSRKSLGPEGKSDVPIGHYQLHRQALIPLIAGTFAMNAVLSMAKASYASVYQKTRQEPEDPKFAHLKCVIICCAVKPLIGWYGANLGTICRERCGGQGYLSENLFGDAIATAHACMTAEGDNRVLWQKASKELTSIFASPYYDALNRDWQKHKTAKCSFKTQLLKDNILGLFSRREILKLQKLCTKLAAAGNQRKKIFDVCMMEEAELFQGVAEAFSERCAIEALATIAEKPTAFISETRPLTDSEDPMLRPILESLMKLYACSCIEKDAAWFCAQGELQSEDFMAVREEKNRIIEDLSPCMGSLVEAFAIPDDCLFAPIAHDWQKLHEFKR